MLLVGLVLLSAVLLCNKDAKEKHQHTFWPRTEVKVVDGKASALLSIFSMDYDYSRDSRMDRDRCQHLPVILGGGVFFCFLKTWAWCNSDQGKFEPFAHTVHAFCYDVALSLQEIKQEGA